MRNRRYFYLVTDYPAVSWELWLSEEPEVWTVAVGGRCWPYTLSEAKKAARRDGKRHIYKFGLPLYNCMKVIK